MILLDTHVWLWSLTNPERLPAAWKTDIEDSSKPVFVSVLSLWEVTIKSQIGKLSLPDSLIPATLEQGFQFLALIPEHVEAIRELPMIHRDPFDRGLIAQASVSGLTLFTSDEVLKQYSKFAKIQLS